MSGAPRGPRRVGGDQDYERAMAELREFKADLDESSDSATIGAASGNRRVDLRLLYLALSGVAALIIILTLTSAFDLVVRFHARSPILAYIIGGAIGTVVISILLLISREIHSVLFLGRANRLKKEVESAIDAEDPGCVMSALRQATDQMGGNEGVVERFKAFELNCATSLPATEIAYLYSRDVLGPVDEHLYRVICRCSMQTAIGTALSTRVSLDVLISSWRNLRLVREIIVTYGGRPAASGEIKLISGIGSAMVTASTAEFAGDLMADVLGGDVLGRLSGRLAEGVANGLMTARVGVIAMRLCRPVPFDDDKQHPYRDIAEMFRKELARSVAFGKSLDTKEVTAPG